MPSSTMSPLFKYSITPIDEGVLLRIWEPAPMNEIRAKPFLFMAKHRLPSDDEAQAMLDQYMAAYNKLICKQPSNV
ncbi:hypothetical protein [Oculatella sp. LEGE 06141]|uniref:hypothetical protein n=2 Tax=Oculatella sp. LEGE 06141 TaxID=1828648 RepID=UPI00187F2EF5|nr:hypothetical protein [Oculatella sp. LEGE 06141]